MKLHIVSFLLLVFISGCAHKNPAPKVMPSADVKVSVPSKSPQPKTASFSSQKNQAFWRLVGRQSVTLTLQNLDRKLNAVVVTIDDETFYHPLATGEWRITAFEIEGKKYQSLRGSLKPVFRVARNSYSYAGALIIQCPKVGQENFENLKLMKFFNRYQFSSGSQLCELVVGNDFDLVKESWQKPKGKPSRKLSLGL